MAKTHVSGNLRGVAAGDSRLGHLSGRLAPIIFMCV